VLQWRFGPAASRDVDDGGGHLVLRRSSLSREPALARPVSRIAIRGASPAAYELRFRARPEGTAHAEVWLDYYRFDAGALGLETASQRIARRKVRMDVTASARWRPVALALQPPPAADYVLPYVVLQPSGSASALSIDDVAVVEWRAATGPVRPDALDYVRNVGSKAVRETFVNHPLVRAGAASQ